MSISLYQILMKLKYENEIDNIIIIIISEQCIENLEKCKKKKKKKNILQIEFLSVINSGDG